MEDEVMEQIRSRLAAATSAATALAKSLEALDENTLQTLEFWLAKQEGDSRCGHCRAQMPRGIETSVCISCGSKRPPLPNTVEYDFKVSFAFLQFLETIHPPLKSGSRRSWNSTVSTASGTSEPSTGIEDLSVEREGAAEAEEVNVTHLKEDLTIDEKFSPNDFQGSLSDDNNGMEAAEDDRETDDYGEFQESWAENAVETTFEKTADVTELIGPLHSDQYTTDFKYSEDVKEPEVVNAAAANSEAVNTWDSEWDYSPSHVVSANTQSEDRFPPNNMLGNDSKEVTSAAPQVPDYDLSIFESVGGIATKEQNGLPDNDADATFWDFQATHLVNSRLASLKEMERFASDTSAFTTITDAESDSGDSSLEALPPPKPPLDILMELGASNGQNDLLGSLNSHELDDFQRIAASSHPLATMPSSQDPFSWSLDTLDTLSSHVVGVAIQNAESSSATNLEASGQVALDPFPWPLEEFDNGTSSVIHAIKQQEPLDLMDPVRAQSEGNSVDLFSWPLDTSIQIMPGVDKGNGIGLDNAPQAQAYDTTEEESEDWGDEEFVWSQAEPANLAPLVSNVDLHSYLSGSSPLGADFSSHIIAGDVSMDKDTFLFDQSSPKPSVTNFSTASADNFADFGNGLESLVTMEGQKTIVQEDLLKSTHVRSLSFGDSDQKPSGLDHIEDFFKRSVSFGNLQVNGQAEGDELLKALQAPSNPQPAPTSIAGGEDILNFLNFKPAASSELNEPQRSESFTKPSHVRSVSFGTVELVPEEQSDEMFQFFHTRSHSAGSSANKSSGVEDNNRSSSGEDIFDKLPSMPKTVQVENPIVNDDPFRFIHSAIGPLAQAETVEVEAATIDDDDDFFEWKSAEIPSANSSEVNVQTMSQPSVSIAASSHQDLFQWASPKPSAPSQSKSLGTGSLSGLLSLAGGLPPSQTRTSFKEDDLFAVLSRNSSNAGQVQVRQTTMQVDVKPQPEFELHNSKPGDDSEDEFSDFVSTGALASAPLPASTQQSASQPAFDVSFFEAAQPNPSEKRNSDFFGDLMGLNFTNA